jgi:glycosyltransferase involved in cell wall biosynthesis
VTIAIVIPTVGRPQRIAALVENITSVTAAQHRIVFVVEADDADSAAAVRAAGLESLVNTRTRNYAGAVNMAYRATDDPYLFTAADDLRFHPGWDIAALACMDDQTQVVGTADLLNPYVARGWHATHYLVDRTYLDTEGGVVDEGPGSFLPECYDHNYTDTEFIGTAKARVRFSPCLDSVVEHMHALSGKGVRDVTAERTLRHYAADEALYDSRRELWWNLSR